MGDDLKATLGKVAGSGGRKTYAFGYLAGKRKDKKGEGSLDVVPGRKTFKKEDLNDELSEAGTLYQGKCWGDSEGQVIFFGCKTLTDSIVDKIKTMVTKTTGKTFHFELPDPAEEKRQATLEEVELAAERNRKGGNDPAQSATPKPEATPAPSSTAAPGQAPVPPPAPPGGPRPAATSKPPTDKPAVDPAAKSYESLLASMQDPLKQLEGTNPAEAAKVRTILDAAATHAKPGEYPKAVGFVKEAGKALAAAAPTESSARGAKAGGPAGSVAVAVLRKEIETVRQHALGGLSKLAAAVADTNDPDAAKLAAIVKKLAIGLPADLEVTLKTLEAAVEANDPAQVKQVKANVQVAVKNWMAFMTTHAKPLEGCENNPWKIPVAITTPMRESLKAVLKVTA